MYENLKTNSENPAELKLTAYDTVYKLTIHSDLLKHVSFFLLFKFAKTSSGPDLRPIRSIELLEFTAPSGSSHSWDNNLVQSIVKDKHQLTVYFDLGAAELNRVPFQEIEVLVNHDPARA